MLLYGVIITLISVIMLLFPNRRVRRIEDRIAAGDDRFFEEQRTYQSYPHLRSVRATRIIGAVGTICGVVLCALQIYAR